MFNRFLFHYNIGARGDFLGAILLNRFDHIQSTNYSISPVNEKIVKIHGIKNAVSLIKGFPSKFESFDELFETSDKFGLINIKIVAETFEEKADVAYFGFVKSVLPKIKGNKIGLSHLSVSEAKTETFTEDLRKAIPWLCEAIYRDIPTLQEEDKDYLGKYQYIIKFEQLFDIDFLKKIYQEINQEPLPPFLISKLKENIKIQDRLSKSSNFQLFRKIYQNHKENQELILSIN